MRRQTDEEAATGGNLYDVELIPLRGTTLTPLLAQDFAVSQEVSERTRLMK
jgi:hypothetical protein